MTHATITTDAAAAGRREARILHRPPATRVQWWSTAAVYETHRLTTVAALLDVAQHVSHVASLGCDALLLDAAELDPRHPSVADAVAQVVHRAHRRALRVVAAVTPLERSDTPASHLVRVQRWLDLGVDGIDLGVGSGGARGPGRGAAPGELHALLADRERALTGAVHGLDLEAYVEMLHDDWLHATRDDRLARSAWTRDEVARELAAVYAAHAPVGDHPAWALSTTSMTVQPSWLVGLDEAVRAGRMRAMTALTVLLPGSVYLRQGVELARTPDDVPATIGDLVGEIAPMRHRDGSSYEQLRTWLRIRHELGAANGHLGLLGAGAGAGAGVVAGAGDMTGAGADADHGALVLVMDSRHLVLTFDRPVVVPEGALVTHSSAPVTTSTGDDTGSGGDGVVVVGPGTTALLKSG